MSAECGKAADGTFDLPLESAAANDDRQESGAEAGQRPAM
jgi:hypothetical protein